NINMIINSTTIVAGIEKSPSIFDRSVGEIYPNPSFDNSKLEINLMEAARVDVSIFKSIGQLIRTNTYELSTGKNLIEINSSELVNGIYTIRLESNIGQAYRKFVKVSK
ncbi:MAG: T9SS type A sorting domain-containing protein, partial [Saprospiraceae bacterium]|nr:T9SS type A sorting domain-containing protein [Saprospiraceae bacterium]